MSASIRGGVLERKLKIQIVSTSIIVFNFKNLLSGPRSFLLSLRGPAEKKSLENAVL